MPLSPVQLPNERSRASELYVWLRAAILSGALKPHERLVETSIAELASVSRTPVREALHRLEVDGLVREGDGGLEVVGFSLDELTDLCAVRETLEGMAARLAAAMGSEMELETLRRITIEEEGLVEDDSEEAVYRHVELNHAFHEALGRASKNRYLADQLRHLRGLIERLQDMTPRDWHRVEEAVREHQAIVDSIARRDPDAAEELARNHMRKSMIRRLGMSLPAPDTFRI
jgi:DNA-binding GntR family transcriptional regulator